MTQLPAPSDAALVARVLASLPEPHRADWSKLSDEARALRLQRFDAGLAAWREELLADLRKAGLPEAIADAAADRESPYGVALALCQTELFFETVFGGEATDGDVCVMRADSNTITDRDLDAISEFVSAGPDGEAWVSMQTRSEDTKLYEQAAVAAHPKDINRFKDMPPPSIKLRHAEGDVYLIWLLKDTVDLRKGELAKQLTDAAPLPGFGGWSIEAVDTDLTYELKDLQSIMVPPAPAAGEVVPYGKVDPELLAREMTLALSPQGQQTKPGNWRNKPFTVQQLIDILSLHKIGEKDGACILQGPVIDGKRMANAVPHLDLLIIDLDTGQSIDEMRAKLQEKGLFAIVYTTHSHGKTLTEIKRDELIKHLDGNTKFDLSDICNYLITKKRYQPELLEGAELIDSGAHTGEGIKVRIEHKPMPKFRVVLVLKEPFIIKDRADTQQEAIKIWKELYAGASQMLGAYFDRSCVDPSRLFFTPRHPKTAKEWRVEIIAGNTLDIDTCERISAEDVRRASLDPMEREAEDIRGNRGKDYKTDQLKWFFGKYGSRFEVETFLADVDPDGDRGQRASGVGRVHRCPNDDAHSDAGNEEDKGFFCVNATDSDRESAVAHCSHDSCSTLDRMDFVDMICERVGIKDAKELLKNDSWVPKTKEDESEGSASGGKTDKPTNRAYKNFAEAKRAVGNMDASDPAAVGIVAVNIGMTPKLKSTELEHLKKEWCKRAKMGPKVFLDEVKRGKQLAAEAAEGTGEYDDDTLQELRELNKEYAVVLIGGKGRIAKFPHETGVLVDFLEVDAFSLAMQNRKVRLFDANGNSKLVPLSKMWREWEGERRTYLNGVVFRPDQLEVPGALNLWSEGYPVKPRRGDWSFLQEHLLNNICLGVGEYRDFLMTWMADIIQHPAEKKGSSVIVTGKKGTGKTFFFEWLLQLLGPHGSTLSQRRHFTGHFNKHLYGKVFALVEEALFAGDAEAGAVMKHLITSSTMAIEGKGLDVTELENHLRFGMTSNSDWVVPASFEDERRFFVLHCGEERRGDHDYFERIAAQMNAGGLEAMMHDLSVWRPEDDNWNVLRKPPVTPWLTRQAEESMYPWERFFLGIIEAGNINRHGKPDSVREIPLFEGEPNRIVREDLIWYYEASLRDSTTGRRKIGDTRLFNDLTREWLLAEEGTVQSSKANGYLDADRRRCIKCPPLSAIKAHLERTKKLRFLTVEDEADEP